MKATLAKNQLAHIDNNFYVLTAAQAKAFSIDGQRPRDGWEKRAANLAGMLCGKIRTEDLPNGKTRQIFRPFDSKPLSESSEGWIKKTPLRWFAGQANADGWVWALHVTKY